MEYPNDDNIRETILSSEKVFDGIVINVEHLTNCLPDGSQAAREVARHVGASAVLPIDDEENVYLVRQYRTPIDRLTLEIPAGKLDHRGEDRLEAAKRELEEETGLYADSWSHITDMLTTLGFCDECISIFLARQLHRGTAHPDADEFLNVVRMPLAEAITLVETKQIQDSKTICALLFADRYLHK